MANKKKALRTTKLGMGTKRVKSTVTDAPPPFSCVAPRVPTFEPVDSEGVKPPPSPGPSASGIRRSQAARVPRVVADEAERIWIPIEPGDAFVVARIDGVLTVEELADLLEMTPADLDAALARLVALEVVVLE